MGSGSVTVLYQFIHKGERYAIDEKELINCYPSISDDGSYFFTLMDGTFIRGEQVKEVLRKNSSPLEAYRQPNYP